MNAQQHDSAQAKQFFDRWTLYQQVIEYDYMAHRSIHAALREFVATQIDPPLTLLDLGCGDASAIPNTFARLELQSYTGVDLSSVALGQAANNLQIGPFKVNLVEDDFTHYLAQDGSGCFNVILAGFALHHLYPKEKQEFFKQCHTKLKRPGYLLLYDVFRRPSETRDEWLQAYLRHCGEHWTRLPHKGLANAKEHIQACDYPETYETLATMAHEAGFTASPKLLFKDAPQFHCLYGFQTTPT